MKLKGKVVLELSALEVERLLAILMDEDKEEGFRFLKECLEKKVQDKTPLCACLRGLLRPEAKGSFHKKVIS